MKIGENEQIVFNTLLPYIEKYSEKISQYLFEYFDKNIILLDSNDNPYTKKLIGFEIFKSDYNNIYIDKKFRNINNVEHSNTLAYYKISTKIWKFYRDGIKNDEEWYVLLDFVSSIVRKIKIDDILDN